MRLRELVTKREYEPSARVRVRVRQRSEACDTEPPRLIRALLNKLLEFSALSVLLADIPELETLISRSSRTSDPVATNDPV